MTNLDLYRKVIGLNNAVDKALDFIIRVFNTHRHMVGLKAENLSLTQQWQSAAFREVFLKRIGLTSPLNAALQTGHNATEALAVLRVALYLEIFDNNPGLKDTSELLPLNWVTSDCTYNNAKKFVTEAHSICQDALAEARIIFLDLLTKSSLYNGPEDVQRVIDKERKVYNAYEVLASIGNFAKKCQKLLTVIPNLTREKRFYNPEFTPELLESYLGQSLAASLEEIRPDKVDNPRFSLTKPN